MRDKLIPFIMSGLAACASVEIPADLLERSQAAIRGAEEVGAEKVPAAKLHLQLARDQADSAKSMAEDGDSRALMVLERAEADAELALVLAREVELRAAAAKAAEELKALKLRATP